jgi:hypothetical protein
MQFRRKGLPWRGGYSGIRVDVLKGALLKWLFIKKSHLERSSHWHCYSDSALARENAPAGNGPLDVFDPNSAKMSRPGPVQALRVPGTAWRLTKNRLL